MNFLVTFPIGAFLDSYFSMPAKLSKSAGQRSLQGKQDPTPMMKPGRKAQETTEAFLPEKEVFKPQEKLSAEVFQKPRAHLAQVPSGPKQGDDRSIQ